jgi:kynurenine formamidase
MATGAPLNELIRLARAGKVYDLAQPYYVGMPHHPVHPPYLFGMTKKHGDYIAPGGVSSAADAIAFGGHVGTHIDALCHFSCGGKLHDGSVAEEVQAYGTGMERLAVDGVAPILRRGVLLDIAGLEGVDVLPVDFSITPAHLDAAVAAHRVQPEPGDVVILRTGWARYWSDAAKFIAEVRGPGPEAPAAHWLSSRNLFAVGSDTVAFELVPARSMPVHVHLLVESGIHIIECLNMERLAADRVYEFLFVAAPLRIQGGTGSPLRPLAVVA